MTMSACGQSDPYFWTQAAAPGSGSFPEEWRAGKFPMGIVPVVAFNDHLYMVGRNTAWISDDGLSWNAYPKTDWGERHGMTITFFKGKLWAMGGMKTWDAFCNDIWVSSDGMDWRQIAAQSAWPKRRGHAVVVYGEKLWLMGGSVSSGVWDQLPTQSLNDVWSSQDGVHWFQESERAEWSAREPRVVIFNDMLFLIGDTDKSDVWYSDNGKTWKLLAEESAWPARQNSGLLVYDGRLWIFGGRGLNDVWSSHDGVRWQQHWSAAPWSTRTTNNSITYRDKIWIYCGKTGRDESWSGDVWTMSSRM